MIKRILIVNVHMKPIQRDVVLRQKQQSVSLPQRYTSRCIVKQKIVHLDEYEQTSDLIYRAASNPHLGMENANVEVGHLKLC